MMFPPSPWCRTFKRCLDSLAGVARLNQHTRLQSQTLCSLALSSRKHEKRLDYTSKFISVVSVPFKSYSIDSRVPSQGEPQRFDSPEEASFDQTSKVPKTVFTILGYLKDSGVDIKQTDEERCISIIHLLIKSLIPPRHISEGLKVHPDLFTISKQDWQAAVKVLQDYGFKDDQIMPLLCGHRELFNGKTKKLYKIGETLRYVGFHDGPVHRVLTACPELLQEQSEKIILQYNELLKIFKKNEIVQITLQSPKVLIEPLKDLQAKVDYILDHMGIGFKSMISCNVFSYSLLHIKTRHEFLKRSGSYKMPDPKSVLKTENVPLRSIVESNDKRFSRKIAGLSLAEYEAFKNIIILEQDLSIDDDLDNEEGDSDSETDD